ncbi:mannosyltransferase [Lineolata rhizophorae]|uniref:Alpha-1,3/1,6-mannosyltransferase ALG2 n=1 Tax=Lineolata rhizophorae TaxID=578093 RepID=A0A6A6P5E2_9PEZI|nr:mannosyltransferase [Lineolata rhizophorae]
MMPKFPQHVVFFHPDLGIGGAERLVIDAAVGLQGLGHRVTIFTSHCDPKHCFDEARDGTLDVRVRGNFLVPSSMLGRFAILCAILRQVHLILQIALFTSELRKLKPTVFFVDQLSAGIPLLRYLSPNTGVIFYCHFPDKLLARKGGRLKELYRVPFDSLESWSTGCSDTIVVNSTFTRQVFATAFPKLKDIKPEVLYPCVDVNVSTIESEKECEDLEPMWKGKKVLLSINRFEKKKDVGLAIRAYAGLDEKIRRQTLLVIAGGYDHRVPENFSTYAELCFLAESYGLRIATAKNVITALSVPSDISVLFLLSVPNTLKHRLLYTASLLVYTPRNEHFGIVPLEAMLAGTPVLAANEGGPTETVVEGKTGWLRDARKDDEWTEVMHQVLHGVIPDQQLQEMGTAGRKRVEQLFSKEKMARDLEGKIEEMLKVENKRYVQGGEWILVALGIIGAVSAFGFAAALYVVSKLVG